MFTVLSLLMFRNCFVMKWTVKHDIELCKEIVVSKPFETKKKSVDRGKVWEAIAKKLEQHDFLTFRVDQRAVRDRTRKLLAKYRKKEREEITASGISPETNELDDLLEEIDAQEEANDVVAAQTSAEEKVRIEADKVAAAEVRKRVMESLSETKKRKEDEQGKKERKVRKGADSALEYLREKAEKDRMLKEESCKLEREKLEMQKQQMEAEKHSREQFMHCQSQMVENMLEMQRQQSQQMQASQLLLAQQQQQQGQALMSLIAKLVEK